MIPSNDPPVPNPLLNTFLKADLKGHRISKKDRDQILKALTPCDSSWAIDLMLKAPIAGCHFRIPWGKRHPDSFHHIEWLDAQGIIDEATKHQPGIAAIQSLYFPIGRDPEGNPNSYFLRCATTSDPALYQIYHDKIGPDGRLESRAIKRVLPNVADLIKFM